VQAGLVYENVDKLLITGDNKSRPFKSGPGGSPLRYEVFEEQPRTASRSSATTSVGSVDTTRSAFVLSTYPRGRSACWCGVPADTPGIGTR
jgi:hypothetical protein